MNSTILRTPVALNAWIMEGYTISMGKWKLPPKIKILEALGSIGDGRIVIKGNTARVQSSSGRKWYDVSYDPHKQAIMSNDNGSYWQGYLGYPAIAFLMQSKIINYDSKYAKALAGIPWKDLNTRFKNNYAKTEAEVKSIVAERGMSSVELSRSVDGIYKQIKKLSPKELGKRMRPPDGY